MLVKELAAVLARLPGEAPVVIVRDGLAVEVHEVRVPVKQGPSGPVPRGVELVARRGGRGPRR